MSLKAFTFSIAALSAGPAFAEDASRFDPHSAIFNAGANDFIGVTVQGCTEDGQSVEVTMNPVAHKNDIAAGMVQNSEEFRGAANGAMSSMQMELRGLIAGVNNNTLKELSRFGQTRQVDTLTDRMQTDGFPVQLQGVRLFTKPAPNGMGCLFS